MWNRFERYVVPKEAVVDVIKGSKVSKMDQDIMREKLNLQRENIVQPQIAAGREFKGKSSFNSKPTVVHFKVMIMFKVVTMFKNMTIFKVMIIFHVMTIFKVMTMFTYNLTFVIFIDSDIIALDYNYLFW